VDSPAHCAECAGVDFAFEAARAVGPLRRPLSKAITVFKDGGERRLARGLADLLATSAGDWSDWADALAFVPASRQAVLRRGFDHAETLAGQLADMLDVPVVRLLGRPQASDQRGLGRAERVENAAEAFEMAPAITKGEREVPSHVLIVDDVLTTGATLSGAAAALREAGADQVRAVVLARKTSGDDAA
jgi:ComF family protein